MDKKPLRTPKKKVNSKAKRHCFAQSLKSRLLNRCMSQKEGSEKAVIPGKAKITEKALNTKKAMNREEGNANTDDLPEGDGGMELGMPPPDEEH
eukprot:5865300-Lingulodinium_polyedra.AAC.1